MRTNNLSNGNFYHVLNRSIAQYQIFKELECCERFRQILDLYRYLEFSYKYSGFLELSLNNQKNIIKKINATPKLVKIVAYCIMPTHFHLILYQINDNGISKFMQKVLNSYSRYFNLKYHRKGPLWEGRFKSILVDRDEQLLHLSRYIHLNPVSASLVEKPEDWTLSSYLEYINPHDNYLCEFDDLMDLSPNQYKKFVNDQIAYQKELSKIKHLIIENYSD